MSKKFTKVSVEDLKNRAKAKLARKGHEKSTSASSDPTIVTPKSKAKRKRTKMKDNMISLKISEEASIYADPGSLADSFDSLVLPKDVNRYKELGLQSALFVWQQCLKHANK
ncbi:hypothetical protein Dimus_033225, partial [Dionaea muscipula]